MKTQKETNRNDQQKTNKVRSTGFPDDRERIQANPEINRNYPVGFRPLDPSERPYSQDMDRGTIPGADDRDLFAGFDEIDQQQTGGHSPVGDEWVFFSLLAIGIAAWVTVILSAGMTGFATILTLMIMVLFAIRKRQ